MNTQTILWTALPNGMTDSSTLKLSVFVSFRLSAEGSASLTLNDYASLIGWTAAVRDSLRLSVEFENGPKIPFNDPAAWNALLKPEYWEAMFTHDSPVTPYEIEPLDAVPIISYPVKSIEEYVKKHYVDVANTWPQTYPPAQDVLKAFEDASLFQYETTPMSGTMPPGARRMDPKAMQKLQPMMAPMSGRVRARVEQNLQMLLKSPGMQFKQQAVSGLQSILKDLGTSRRILSDGQNVTRDFLAFSLFHTAMAPEAKTKQVQPGSTKLHLDLVEFHEAVSSLGDYPDLMRRVGLVIDLAVPVQPGIPASSFVQVKAQWTAAFNDSATINFSPKTKYTLTGDDFRAAPAPGASEIKNGMFDLSNTQNYDLVQLDVDGAAMKIKGLLATLEQTDIEAPPVLPVLLAHAGSGNQIAGFLHQAAATPQAGISLPALRTQGISIVRVDRTKAVVSMLNSQAKYNTSLVYAQMHPSVLKNPKTPKTEVDKTEVRLYAEDLVRGYRVDAWYEGTGQWHSLCKRKTTVSFLRKPGMRHDETVEGAIGMAVTAPPPADGDVSRGTPEELRLSENLCRWDGWSLVAPRPGKRITDLDETEDNSNAPATFTGLSALTEAEGNSLPRLRFGKKYRLRARIADLAGNGRDLTAIPAGDLSTATRETTFLRLEPAASPVLALKTPLKPGESVERIILRSNYNQSVQEYRSDHNVSDPDPERHILAPRCSQQMAEYHGKFDGMTAADAYALITSRDGAPANVYPGNTVSIPFLPDPLARGASLSFTWNDKPVGSLELMDFASGGTAWPAAKSFRIKVLEHADTAKVERSSDDLITVSVPKAGVVKVRYSSYVDDSGATLLAIAGWVGDLSSVNAEKVRTAAKQGLHWMVTPSRELLIVHAVQQPLAEPAFKKLVPIKSIGATYALLHGDVTLHGASTDRFDMRAEWSEPFDDIAQPEWKTIDGKAQPFSLSVTERDSGLVFGDRNIPVQSNDQTSQLGFSAAAVQGQEKKDTQVLLPATAKGLLVPESVYPVQRHDFGDTKYRKIKYTGVAVTRFRECFLDLMGLLPGGVKKAPLPLTREGSTEVEVLNSARPHAPKVSHIVPTFQWERKEDDVSIISRRCGGGLRVFLERPWFSSGDGELLGVVVNPGGKPLDETDDDDNRLKPYVTQWGLDPIVKSSGVIKLAPRLDDFKNTARTQTNVTLEELPQQVGTANIGAMVPLHVAGYKPEFDKERGLWFADVVLDPGQAYFPFIRLALVRYQPNSIRNAHLSHAVLTDFIQVVPDRVAAVTCESDKKIVVQVAGVYATRSPAAVQPLSVLNRSMYFTATLERKAGEGDFGWWPVSDATQISAAEGTDAADRMIPTEIHDTKMRWVKEITVSDPVKKGTKQHRIVVREYEVHTDDEGNKIPRLVYADAIEI